jgi:DNA-binding GntR family transcriptional regulator
MAALRPRKAQVTALPPASRHAAGRSARSGASRGASAAALIYADLRAGLISLKRLPGEPLSESEVAFAHGVSRTPVREAILRLAGEGLVEIFPQSGTFVSRIPLAALPEAIIIRKSLEETTSRLAAERATPSQILALRTLLEHQAEASAAGDQDAFHRADEAFHGALADAAGYPGIWALILKVKIHVDRYRRLTLPQLGRMMRARAEHVAIAEAVAAHDPARAAAAMAAHLDGLLSDIPDISRLNPDYFDAAPQRPVEP